MNAKTLVGLLGCWLMCSCSGAYEEGEEFEDLAVDGEAIGEATCATVAPDMNAWGVVNTVSPVTYGRTECRKAMIIDVANFGAVPGSGTRIQTTWTGEMPKTENDCYGTSVRTDVYVYQASPPGFVFQDSQTVRGRWNPKMGCGKTKTTFTLTPGLTYRFVNQSLVSPAGATRSFSMSNAAL